MFLSEDPVTAQQTSQAAMLTPGSDPVWNNIIHVKRTPNQAVFAYKKNQTTEFTNAAHGDQLRKCSYKITLWSIYTEDNTKPYMKSLHLTQAHRKVTCSLAGSVVLRPWWRIVLIPGRSKVLTCFEFFARTFEPIHIFTPGPTVLLSCEYGNNTEKASHTLSVCPLKGECGEKFVTGRFDAITETAKCLV